MRTRGMLFSMDAMLASMAAIMIFLLLLGYYSNVMGELGIIIDANRRIKIIDEVMRALVYTPGGVMLTKEEAGKITINTSQNYYYGDNPSSFNLDRIVTQDEILYPFWTDTQLERQFYPPKELDMPGLTVYDTGVLAPIPFILLKDKVDNIQKVADLIYRRMLESGEKIEIKVEYIEYIRGHQQLPQKVVASAGQGDAKNVLTKSCLVWILEPVRSGQECTGKMYLGRLTVTLTLY